MSDKLKVAAYCRVSTDKDDQANSLASQIDYFTKYISNNNEWEMVEVYYDEGITGTSTKKRTGFNRMIADALNGRIDLLLTKEISRFARNTLDSISYTRELKEKGIGVVFINDNINTLDNDSELRLTIMSSIAQEESRKTSERVKWGQKRRMELGVVFGRDMLGYFVRNGKLIVNPDEVDVVKLIFHKYLYEEKGTWTIARELYNAGIKPKRVREWSNTMILKVLRNEKYVGDLLQKKTYTPNYLSHSKKYNNGHEEKVYLRDHHEPIIDRKTWDAVQKELERRSPSNEQKSKHSNRYWCSGKLICGECGQRFVSKTKKLSDGSVYKAWRCYAAANHGTAKIDEMGNRVGCDSSSINDKVLLYCVGYVLKHIQINKDKIIKDLMQSIKSVQSINTIVDTAGLYEQISQINKKKAKAYDLVIEGLMSKDDLKLQIEEYDSQIRGITSQISEAENANSIRQMQLVGINQYIVEIKRILNFDTENEFLYRELVDRIKIYNGNAVEVYMKCLPSGIRLVYSSKGKMDKFIVSIDKMEILH